VNGQSHHVQAAADTPLLSVLRNERHLNAPKFGCGLGQCAAIRRSGEHSAEIYLQR
jgi:nicotinate dehydrogenase subunit A